MTESLKFTNEKFTEGSEEDHLELLTKADDFDLDKARALIEQERYKQEYGSFAELQKKIKEDELSYSVPGFSPMSEEDMTPPPIPPIPNKPNERDKTYNKEIDFDDAEKERKEKIQDNRATYESLSDSIYKSQEVYFNPLRESGEKTILGDDSFYRDMVESVDKLNSELTTRLKINFYKSQAPLLIKDEQKRKSWEERIDKCIAQEQGLERGFGFSPVEACDEECLEALALDKPISNICEILQKYEDRPGASFQQIKDIVTFSDRGEEFADYIGFSDIDFENDSIDIQNNKIQKVAQKVGFKRPEDFFFRSNE